MRTATDFAWVGAQMILFVVIGALVATTSGEAPRIAIGTGGVIALAGLIFAMAGVNRLGRSLSPFPTPTDDAELVTQGSYRFARHPIYGGVILLCFGISLAAGSIGATAVSLVFFPFFLAKSSHEELMLIERFPGYAAYAESVPHRLLPWLV